MRTAMHKKRDSNCVKLKLYVISLIFVQNISVGKIVPVPLQSDTGIFRAE